MKIRIISAAIGIPLLLAVLYIGGIVFKTTAILISLVAIYEILKAMRLINIVTILSTISSILVVYFVPKEQVLEYFSLIVFLNLLMTILIPKYSINEIGKTIFTFFYVAIPIYMLVSMYSVGNEEFVWLILTIAFSSDTMAYFAGSYFGKHKLIPDISPNKTIEGSIGGIIGAVIGGLIFNKIFLLMTNLQMILLVAILGSIISQFGDLIESKIKRQLKIKDFGNIIPGHGGIVDRLDSILMLTVYMAIFINTFNF
jgi:phosphatidate cytidylyltransferase